MIDSHNPKKIKSVIVGLIGLVLSLSIITFLFIFRNEIQSLSYLGYVGLFVSCFVANASVFFPAPSTAIVMGFSASFSPFWTGVIGGTGAALGELVGYYAGRSGRNLLQNNRYTRLVENIYNKNGPLAVFIFAILPFPLFDIVGFNAGIAKMPLWKFFFLCLCGKIVKMLLYAFFGRTLFSYISSLDLPFIDQYLESIK